MKHGYFSLLLLVGTAAVGCRPGDVPPTAASPEPVHTWSDQVADVRAGRSDEIVATTETIGPDEWSQLGEGCSQLRILDVEKLEDPAAELALLEQLPQLERIRIGSLVDDDALEHIARASSLKIVNLPDGEFTDAGLERLTTLPKLELLRFSSPNVTDAGMAHVATIESLRFLHVIDTPITDEGIRHLHSMADLESFYLDGGRCSDEALGELLRALPNLHFHRDQLHLPGDPRAGVRLDCR